MENEKTAKSKIIHNYINLGVVFGVMILAHFIPAPAPITPLGVQIIGIFVGMIYGWATCGMLWPSLAGILMLGFTEFGGTPQNALGMAITNQTALMMLCCFVAFNYITDSGLTTVLARWLVTRKFTAGKPWVFVIFFMTAGILISGVFNSIILILVAFEFLTPLFKEMGYTKEDMFPTYLLLGVAVNLGMCTVWPAFLPHSIYTRGIIASALGYNLSTWQYTMCIAFPLLVMAVIYVLVGKFIIRVDTSKFAAGSQAMLQRMEQDGKNKKLSDDEKSGAIVLTIFVLGLLLPAVFPTTWPVISTLNHLGPVGVSLAIVIAVIVLMKKDGNTLTDFGKLMRGVSWDMIMLSAAIMTIAGSITSEGTGIVAFLAMTITPILSSVPLWVFVTVVIVVMCIISQFSMNMVLQMVFAPILAPILVAAGYNPMIAVMAVYFGTQMAFMAPSGSIMAAMVFGQTEWVKPGNLYKVAIPWILITMVLWALMTLTFPDIFCPL